MILCMRYRISIVLLASVGSSIVDQFWGHAVSKRQTRIERSFRARQSGSSSLRNERNTVIRQTISCDICGAQRRETNHWFIAYEKCRELRVSGWTSRHLLCPGTKHLCGESCLHMLLSEFLAKASQARTLNAADSPALQLMVSSVHMNVPAEPRATRHVHIIQLTRTMPRCSIRAREKRRRPKGWFSTDLEHCVIRRGERRFV